MMCKTGKWLRRCSFCIVDLAARGDQAVQQTHGVANLSLICCAYITTQENEQHCFDDVNMLHLHNCARVHGTSGVSILDTMACV